MSKFTIEQWQQFQKNEKDLIVQASSIEETEGPDKMTEHPIGLSYLYRKG